MLDRMEGNAELKNSVQLMLAARRLTHSVLLVGEEGLGAGFAARCIAADYLYPAGGAPAEALLRGECCRAVGKPGDRDSGHVGTGIVREAISVAGMGAGGKYLVSQVKAMRSEIFNTSLSAEGRAVLLYHVEKMNEESANALLKVMEEPPEGAVPAYGGFAGRRAAHHPQPLRQLCSGSCLAGAVRPLLRRRGGQRRPRCTANCSTVTLARCLPPHRTMPAPRRWKRPCSWQRPLPTVTAMPQPACWPPTKRTRPVPPPC